MIVSILTISTLVVLFPIQSVGRNSPTINIGSRSSRLTEKSFSPRAAKSKEREEDDDSAIHQVPIPQNYSDPLGITIAPNGDVWFAETNPNEIVAYNPTNNTFNSFPVPATNNSGLIWFPIYDSGLIWFSCANEPLLWSFSTTTHDFVNFSTDHADVNPYSLALDNKTNEIWFTSIYTDQIGAFQINPVQDSASLVQLVNLTGPIAAKPGSGPKYGPSGLAIDPNNDDIYVSETFAPAIVEYSETTQDYLGGWTLPAGSQPVGIALDNASNSIWFTNHASSLFGFVNRGTGKVTEFATSVFSYNFTDTQSSDVDSLPYWVQISPSGLVWIDEHVGNKIGRFDPANDQFTEFIIPTPQSAPLRFAFNDQTNEVWFTEFQGNNLGVINQNESCGCLVQISEISVDLADSQASIVINLLQETGQNSSETAANQAEPLLSGSLEIMGNVSSNLTVSYRSINSSAFEASIERGPVLAAGNYTLTFCANDTMSPIRQCGEVYLSVPQSSHAFSLSNPLDIELAALILVAVLLAAVVPYASRWRRKSSSPPSSPHNT